MMIMWLNPEIHNNKDKTCDTLDCGNSAKYVLWNSFPEPQQLACEVCKDEANKTGNFPKTR